MERSLEVLYKRKCKLIFTLILFFKSGAGKRQFVSLVAASKLSEPKAIELIRTAIIRARFLEQHAVSIEIKKQWLFFYFFTP